MTTQTSVQLEGNRTNAANDGAESAMPIYVHCPHCEHPTVLPSAVDGRCYRCRQCNGFYVVQINRPRRAAV